MPSVLITGAGRGIGEAIALRLASAGWTVLAGVRNDSSGDRLAVQRTYTDHLNALDKMDLDAPEPSTTATYDRLVG